MAAVLARLGVIASRRPRRGLIGAAVLLGWLAPTPAPAQIGYGWWFGGYQTPASVTSLNDRAMARTQAALAARPQALRAPGRSGRDTTFFERYDFETRRGMEARVSRRASRPSPPAPTAPAPAPVAADPTPRRHVVALATLFNAQDEVLWPPAAPVEGSLQAKRTTSDAASLSVLKETRSRGVAKVASVAEARVRLLDYGRPALELVRGGGNVETEEAFHAFLLSLYDSLGAAALGPSALSR